MFSQRTTRRSLCRAVPRRSRIASAGAAAAAISAVVAAVAVVTHAAAVAQPLASAQQQADAPPSPARAYLPFALKSPACRLEGTHVDVVLVLDRSTSMARTIPPSALTKNAAAIDAARSFVRLLDLTPDAAGRSDQVAIVGFHDAAWTELALTADEAAADAALDRLAGRLSEGTRLDLAFAGAAAALDGPGRRGANRALVVVLTDGLPNRVPFGPLSPYPGSTRQEDSVRQAAERLRGGGARVATIGLGDAGDVALGLLAECASEPSLFHHAPRAEDLAAVYGRIAVTRRVCDPPPATPRPPTATATPPPTPTACIPSLTHTDASLVLDMSTSMNRPATGGVTRREAALAAARAFVDQLRFAPDARGGFDQVAVSAFHGRAWTALGLGRDAAAAQAALDGLPADMARGTRLDLAFEQGQAALDEGPRQTGNTPALILLTDGQASGVPADPGRTTDETILDRAARAKAAGTVVFTIGFGDAADLDRALLQAAASDPTQYFETPDADDLAAIYRRIAGRLTGCP